MYWFAPHQSLLTSKFPYLFPSNWIVLMEQVLSIFTLEKAGKGDRSSRVTYLRSIFAIKGFPEARSSSSSSLASWL